jgi:hypothetical protein
MVRTTPAFSNVGRIGKKNHGEVVGRHDLEERHGRNLTGGVWDGSHVRTQ